MRNLGGKQILVLGLGVSGHAAAKLAQAHGADVTVLDSSNSPTLEARAATLREQGMRVELAWTAPIWEDCVDLAILSPGIPSSSALGRLTSSLDCEVLAELEFAARYCACPILAITGTNGKTTTVELTTFCLQQSGKRVVAAGNVGIPFSEVCHQTADLDFVVLEVSSFQLEHTAEFKPFAAALLNVTSDHQDRYSGFEHYLETKLRLFENMDDPSRIIVRDGLQSKLSDRLDQQHLVSFSSERASDADYVVDAEGQLCWHEEQLLAASELRLSGSHNVENVLASLALCRLAGIPHAQAADAARRFQASAHRFELVTEEHGVRFINDSKATNPDAVSQAIKTCVQGVDGRIFLIAGGRDKQMDFELVLPQLEKHVKEAFLLGETKDHLARLWDPVVPCTKVASLEAAVDSAVNVAKAGDTVLFSPGCASQDMFEDYADRGNQFKNALKRRLGK